jgi:hypothetical protein
VEKPLFDGSLTDARSDRIAVDFFNSVYAQGEFLWALPLLLKRFGCALNDDFCCFPDCADPDPSLHFDGVKVGSGGGELVMSIEAFETVLRESCAQYIMLHPEQKGAVRLAIEVALQHAGQGSTLNLEV